MKMNYIHIFSFFSLASAVSKNYCPLLGPVYPTPKSLGTDSAFHAAKQNISSTLDAVVAGNSSLLGSTYNTNTTSLSVQLWSTNDSTPLFEYYYTSPLTRSSSIGVTDVDEDTVFRIGSASKLLTVLLLLIEKGDVVLSDHVVKWVPELADAAKQLRCNATDRWDRIDHVQWEELTLRDLATQLSGISRDYGFGDLAASGVDLTAYGFPQPSEAPPCGGILTGVCDRAQFFRGLLQEHPSFPISYTPSYSNANFEILGFVLEAMTNTTYETLLHRDLVEPLGLKHLTYSAPADKYGIIPWDAATSYWAVNTGAETPAGGLYASTKDVTTLGRAILNNHLLSPAHTRRWMKPATHTGSLDFSVGAPWEILSFPTSRVVDVYTKSGDLGSYSSMLGLLPDHSFGFTILAAGNSTSAVVQAVLLSMMETLVPALDAAAKEEAALRFTGIYTHNSTNSSIVITTDEGPGLNVEAWVNDSVDIIQSIGLLEGYTAAPSIRLYPTGLENADQLSFVAIIQQLGSQPNGVPCTDWFVVDSTVYGNVGLDEFLFDLDSAGNAVAVSPRVMRTVLHKSF
ncbi:beta-lactamase/transpeptidase-like protein [Talaromyces proteolyticus]|uniref:Beta-lactamase/transpeptidase-like protein n=1 Tax=Talaromyces proteolyticus TaxID=1131652 RepID=A0AAD4KTF3_9EURO|nr:beta-lactamase/transpeptidase-like protein [Talaromyces proteolyticus]KAH8698897.1 beta-lactamase/transpeptidase-like protein [Talaromyces proteolyticus]